MEINTYWLVLIVVGILFPLVAYWFAPGVVRILLGDLRLPRILLFVALGGMGMALWLRMDTHLAQLWELAIWLKLALLAICLTYSAVFAIVTNNLEDLEADRISNPLRPLVLGTIAPRPYLWAGICCECVALGLAFAADLPLGMGILAVSVGYFVYSCRPLRLKRVPILSKLIIGFNFLSVAVCGYALAGGEWRAFPLVWIMFILLPFSLAANFIDLKDTAGDRAQGVATLPVLLGESLARHLIAAATVATYGMGALLLDIAWVYPLNFAGAALHVYLLYRRPYDERFVFLVLMGALFGLDGFLLIGGNVF